MALSSNSLIHFTKSQDSLYKIIEEGFRLKYCKETFNLSGNDETLHVPMVSFCDIPFSQIKNHLDSYGQYGIGLSKKWAVEKRLNPVLYIQSNSAVANSYKSLVRILNTKEKEGVIDGDARRMAKDIVRYIKKYEGTLEREGQKPKFYRFSDEREWRYVPEVTDAYAMLYVQKKFQKITAERANEKLANERLKFEVDDINYIIIKDDSEIKGLISHLRDCLRGTGSQIERVFTRIITSEQIRGDF